MKRWIAGAIAAGLVVAAAAPAAAQQVQTTQEYWPWYGGSGWSFWWMCPLMMLVMIGMIAVIILSRRHGGAFIGHRHDGALQILNERFARGEIPHEEYEAKKAVIRSPR